MCCHMAKDETTTLNQGTGFFYSIGYQLFRPNGQNHLSDLGKWFARIFATNKKEFPANPDVFHFLRGSIKNGQFLRTRGTKNALFYILFVYFLLQYIISSVVISCKKNTFLQSDSDSFTPKSLLPIVSFLAMFRFKDLFMAIIQPLSKKVEQVELLNSVYIFLLLLIFQTYNNIIINIIT